MPASLARKSQTAEDLTREIRGKRFSELKDFWLDYTGQGRYHEAARKLCWCDRYFLLVAILKRADAFRPWIFERCREVEADPDDHLDLWAREHYKSSIITFAGIIQEVLRDPEITVAIFSHTKPIAKAFLRQIQREFENNEDLKALFPDILWANPEKEARQWSLDGGITVKRKGNPKEATIEAHGLVDGQPTSRHFKLRVYNDVVVPESVSTPEQIERTTEAWSLSDNLGTKGGRRWHEGTRYHYADTYATIMKRGIRERIYPATHDGTKTGRPVLFSQKEWDQKLLTQSDSTIACQQLLNPLSGSVRLFNVEDLQDWQVRPDALMAYLTVDPARSKKRDSANTAMAVIGVDEYSKKYLLDGFDHQMDLMERWQNMRDLWVKWRRAPGVQGIKVGYEVYGAQADMDYFLERQRVEVDCQFPIEELAWPNDGPGSKDDRIQRLLPDIRSHAFHGPYPTDDENITPYQVRMIASGYEHRISAKIEPLDQEGKAYDLWERFKLQASMYPFVDRKDLIDAVSRIYDMEPQAPQFIDSRILEPEVV
jgi:hypothetical protein